MKRSAPSAHYSRTRSEVLEVSAECRVPLTSNTHECNTKLAHCAGCYIPLGPFWSHRRRCRPVHWRHLGLVSTVGAWPYTARLAELRWRRPIPSRGKQVEKLLLMRSRLRRLFRPPSSLTAAYLLTKPRPTFDHILPHFAQVSPTNLLLDLLPERNTRAMGCETVLEYSSQVLICWAL